MTFKCWVLDVEDAWEGEEERVTMNASTDPQQATSAASKASAKPKATSKRSAGSSKPQQPSSGKNAALVLFFIRPVRPKFCIAFFGVFCKHMLHLATRIEKSLD